MPHPQCPALGIPQRPLHALLLAPLKPSYSALRVRPREGEPGRLGGLAKISVLGQMGGQGGREPGCLVSLPTVSLSVRLSVPAPALPSVPPQLCALPLSPEQAGPGTLGPILTASCAQKPPLACRWRCRPRLQPAQPRARWALPPAAQGAGGLRWGPLSYPLVSGLCLPAADALQTHNTVFQEHAAPSSPGAAPTTRGFRRASEISIASQVSGMAESYTASSIAQSECSSVLGLPSLHPPLCPSRGSALLPPDSWQCLETAGEGTTDSRWIVTGVLPNTYSGPKCPERTLEGGSVRSGSPAGPSPGGR